MVQGAAAASPGAGGRLVCTASRPAHGLSRTGLHQSVRTRRRSHHRRCRDRPRFRRGGPLIERLRRAWPWVRRRLPLLVVGITLAVAAVFAYLWWEYRSEENRRREIEEVATDFTRALTDFSAETIEEDVREIKSFAVGSFSDEVDTFFGDETVAAVKEAEATSDGEIECLYVQHI